MTQTTFDARTVEPASTFEPIPTDWYKVAIVDSEMKPTKDGKGALLSGTLNVLEGTFAKRKVFFRLNLQNANPVAQEIAYKQLSAICHATGIVQISINWTGKPAVPQLHGIPFMARVVLKPAQGSYDASNDVKGFKAVSGTGVTPTAGAPAPSAPQWATQPRQPATPPVAPADPAATPAPVQPPETAPAAPAPVAEAPAAPAPGGVPPWAQPATESAK